ncbi:MAG: ribonuclease H-like domain-containing protein [Phycisphaerae bacterium]
MGKQPPEDDRVARLRESLLKGDLGSASEILNRSTGERMFSAPDPQAPLAPAGAGLADLWPGRESDPELAQGAPSCWRAEPDVSEIVPETPEVVGFLRSVLKGCGERLNELAASPGLCHLSQADPRGVVFCRLVSLPGREGPRVVAGVLRLGQQGGQVVQYVARNEEEEAAVLVSVLAEMETAEVWVTFGDRNDRWAKVMARAKALGLEQPWSTPRVAEIRADCRHVWKDELRQFGMRSLERLGLGRDRRGGYPPAVLPRVYRRFAETGDARAMVKLLRRNVMDLVCLVELAGYLLTGRGPVCEMM